MDIKQSSIDTTGELAARDNALAEPSMAMPSGADGSAAPSVEEWRIAFLGGGAFVFSRYINRAPNEVYRPVDLATAAVWASAIIQGFQPPRYLRDSDKPAG